MIRIEFWNGHVSNKKKHEKYDGHITTTHNPCLWTNFHEDNKPWRLVYPKALEYIKQYKDGIINDTELLHSLRYVAYGYNIDGEDKRDYDNSDVIWPGNLTIKHRPKVVVNDHDENYTIQFSFIKQDDNDKPTDNNWKCNIINETNFYWEL